MPIRLFLVALVCAFTASSLHAQFNPNGQITGEGWNFLVPINLGGHGGSVGGFVRLSTEDWGGEAWDIKTDNPKAGDTGPHAGWQAPQISADAIWVNPELLRAGFPDAEDFIADGVDTHLSGDQINYQDYLVSLQNDLLPTIGEGGNIPNDNVMALATTYVRNLTGDLLRLGGCTATDDSVAVWVNNKLVHATVAGRGGNSDACAQDRFEFTLPPGISKIAVGTWEGGGGFNMSFALTDLSANKLADGNDLVEFLGHGVGDNEAVGQLQYCADRSVESRDFNCPPLVDTRVQVSIEGAEGIGDPADPITITESSRGRRTRARSALTSTNP